MSALTQDVLVDRVRTVCAGAPFLFTEAQTWDTFDLQPDSTIDGVFRIPPPSSEGVAGGFGYVEDRTDSLQIWIARRVTTDEDAVRRTLLRDVHSLTAAVVRDGAVTSGDYCVLDEGRGHTIALIPRANYATLRLTLALNYEAQL